MKVLGVSGSPRKDKSTDRLVREVLDAVGVETEFVSLAGKRIGPCIACLGCVKDNVCKVNDDMEQLRSKIVEADAYVIGAANYFSMLNGLSHCFLERFYQFRHRELGAVPATVSWRTLRRSSNTTRSSALERYQPRERQVALPAAMGKPARLGPFISFSGQGQR
jgi:multimeric flavodoxin WrbA